MGKAWGLQLACGCYILSSRRGGCVVPFLGLDQIRGDRSQIPLLRSSSWGCGIEQLANLESPSFASICTSSDNKFFHNPQCLSFQGFDGLLSTSTPSPIGSSQQPILWLPVTRASFLFVFVLICQRCVHSLA